MVDWDNGEICTLNEYKLLCLYLVQQMLHQISAQQFYSDLDLYQQFLQKIEEFKGFSRPLHDFPGLFKTYLMFKDFSRKPSKFKYVFSSLWEPWTSLLWCRVITPL